MYCTSYVVSAVDDNATMPFQRLVSRFRNNTFFPIARFLSPRKRSSHNFTLRVFSLSVMVMCFLYHLVAVRNKVIMFFTSYVVSAVEDSDRNPFQRLVSTLRNMTFYPQPGSCPQWTALPITSLSEYSLYPLVISFLCHLVALPCLSPHSSDICKNQMQEIYVVRVLSY